MMMGIIQEFILHRTYATKKPNLIKAVFLVRNS
jgi:hypothetical protein